MKAFIVVRDERNGREFIDRSDSLIRNFETIVEAFDTFAEAKEKYPEAVVIESTVDSNVIPAVFKHEEN